MIQIYQPKSTHDLFPDTIVVDGYVYLDSDMKKGLGYHLYKSLNESVKVIGVAKNSFHNISEEFKRYRRDSIKPLYITSIGVSLDDAKKFILKMDGEFRFPKLLKLVDAVCRMDVNTDLQISKS